jgi:hypothetical protein
MVDVPLAWAGWGEMPEFIRAASQRRSRAGNDHLPQLWASLRYPPAYLCWLSVLPPDA